jgi:hypothetical protein
VKIREYWVVMKLGLDKEGENDVCDCGGGCCGSGLFGILCGVDNDGNTLDFSDEVAPD